MAGSRALLVVVAVMHLAGCEGGDAAGGAVHPPAPLGLSLAPAQLRTLEHVASPLPPLGLSLLPQQPRAPPALVELEVTTPAEWLAFLPWGALVPGLNLTANSSLLAPDGVNGEWAPRRVTLISGALPAVEQGWGALRVLPPPNTPHGTLTVAVRLTGQQPQTTAAASIRVDVEQVNDAPVVSMPAGPLQLAHGAGVALLGVTIDDPDLPSGGVLQINISCGACTLQLAPALTSSGRMDASARRSGGRDERGEPRVPSWISLAGTLPQLRRDLLAVLVARPHAANATSDVDPAAVFHDAVLVSAVEVVVTGGGVGVLEPVPGALVGRGWVALEAAAPLPSAPPTRDVTAALQPALPTASVAPVLSVACDACGGGSADGTLCVSPEGSDWHLGRCFSARCADDASRSDNTSVRLSLRVSHGGLLRHAEALVWEPAAVGGGGVYAPNASLPAASATPELIFEGTAAVVAGQLAGAAYRPDRHWFGDAHLLATLSCGPRDTAPSASRALTLEVTPINDPPVLSAASLHYSAAAGDAVALSPISLDDPDVIDPADADVAPVTLTLHCSFCTVVGAAAFALSPVPVPGPSPPSVLSGLVTVTTARALLARLTVSPLPGFVSLARLLLLADDGGYVGPHHRHARPFTASLNITVDVAPPPVALGWVASASVVTLREDTALDALPLRLVQLAWGAPDGSSAAVGGNATVTAAVSVGGLCIDSAPCASSVSLTAPVPTLVRQLAGVLYRPRVNWHSQLPAPDGGFDVLRVTAHLGVAGEEANGGGNSAPATAEVSIEVTPVDDAPALLVGEPASALFSTTQRTPDGVSPRLTGFSSAVQTPQGGALALTLLSVRDVDFGGDLRLSVACDHCTLQTTDPTAAIGGAGQALTAAGTAASLSAALAASTYRGAHGYAGPDTLRVSVSRGALSDALELPIFVARVDQPPMVRTPPLPAVMREDSALPLGIRLFDVDDPDATADSNATLQLVSDAGGVIACSALWRGASVVGNRTRAVHLLGRYPAVVGSLPSCVFHPPPDANSLDGGPMRIALTASVDGATATGDALLYVVPVNDPPSLTGPNAPLLAVEDTAIRIDGVRANDVDSAVDGSAVRLTVTAARGSVALAYTDGLQWVAPAPSRPSAACSLAGRSCGLAFSPGLSVVGQLGDINRALGSLHFRGAADFAGDDVLIVDVADDGGDAVGPAVHAAVAAWTGSAVAPVGGTRPLVARLTLPVSVAPVNDPPTWTVPRGGAALRVPQGGELPLTGVRLSDVDAGASLLRVTLRATAGSLHTLLPTGVLLLPGVADDAVSSRAAAVSGVGEMPRPPNANATGLPRNASYPGRVSALTLFGTLPLLNAALAGLTFTPQSPAAPGAPVALRDAAPPEVHLTAWDGDLAGVTRAVIRIASVDGVNQPPTLVVPGATLTLPPCNATPGAAHRCGAIIAVPTRQAQEDLPLTLGDIALFDPEDALDDAAVMTLTVRAANGTVALSRAVSGVEVAGGSSGGALTLRCPQAACNRALGALAFTGAPNSHGDAVLALQAEDSSGALSEWTTLPIDIAAVNDPVRILLGGTRAHATSALPVVQAREDAWALLAGVSVTDADAGDAVGAGGVYTARVSTDVGVVGLPRVSGVDFAEQEEAGLGEVGWPSPPLAGWGSSQHGEFTHSWVTAYPGGDVGGWAPAGIPQGGGASPALAVGRTLLVSGPLPELSGCLAQLAFHPPPNWNSDAGGSTAAVTVEVSDGGWAGQGPPTNDSLTLLVHVAPQPDPPRVVVSGATLASAGGAARGAQLHGDGVHLRVVSVPPVLTRQDGGAVALPALSFEHVDGPDDTGGTGDVVGRSDLIVTLAAGNGALSPGVTCIDLLRLPLASASGLCPPSPLVELRGPIEAVNAAVVGLRYSPFPRFRGDDVVTVTATAAVSGLSDSVRLPVWTARVRAPPRLVGPPSGPDGSPPGVWVPARGSALITGAEAALPPPTADGGAPPALRAAGTGLELWASALAPPASTAPWAALAANATAATDPTHSLAVRGPEENWRLALVRDIAPGAASSAPRWITPLPAAGGGGASGAALFAAASPDGGRELWRTDGTPGGTAPVLDLAPGPAGGNPAHLLPWGQGSVLFSADGADVASWVASPGVDTCGGVRLTGLTVPDAATGADLALTLVVAANATWPRLRPLDCPRGYAAATTAQAQAAVARARAAPAHVAARHAATPLYAGHCGWVGLRPPDGSPPRRRFRLADSAVTGGALEAGASESDDVRLGDWSPGGFAGMVCARHQQQPPPAGAGAAPLYAGRELWSTDGTPAGTLRVVDLQPGPRGSSPSALTRTIAGGRPVVLFSAARDDVGRELWATDGTPGGAVLAADVRPGPLGSDPRYVAAAGTPPAEVASLAPGCGGAYFSADGGAPFGRELWWAPGAPADPLAPPGVASPGGAVLVADVAPGDAGSDPQQLLVVPCDADAAAAAASGGSALQPGSVLFSADGRDGAGRELWVAAAAPRSGGARPATRLADVCPGPRGSAPGWLTFFAGRVFFAADDCTHGRELWATDGTPGGTVLVTDTAPGAGSGAPAWLSPLPVGPAGGWRLVFAAAVGGTPAGGEWDGWGGRADASDEADAGGMGGGEGAQALVPVQLWSLTPGGGPPTPLLDGLTTSPYFHAGAADLRAPSAADWPPQRLVQLPSGAVLLPAARGVWGGGPPTVGSRAALPLPASFRLVADDASWGAGAADDDDAVGGWEVVVATTSGVGRVELPGVVAAAGGGGSLDCGVRLGGITPAGVSGGPAAVVFLGRNASAVNAALARVLYVYVGGSGSAGAGGGGGEGADDAVVVTARALPASCAPAVAGGAVGPACAADVAARSDAPAARASVDVHVEDRRAGD